MEEIVKELREDKKRAWEMINSLNDRLSKAEKPGKDEDLHNKMDRILKKLEKRTEMEIVKELREDKRRARETIKSLNDRLLKAEKQEKEEELHQKMDTVLTKMEKMNQLVQKVDFLKDKMENLAEEVTKSKEMMKVIDTAETAVGYAELFVKDFDKIHGKMAEMDLKIEDTRQVEHGIIGRMDEIERKIEKACQLECKMEVIGQEVKGIRDEIKGNIEMIPEVLLEVQKGDEMMNSLSEVKQQYETIAIAMESQKWDFDDLKRELAENILKLPVSYKCYNSNCHAVLPKDLELREDGVSVECPNIECTSINIIEKLKRGHKWMAIHCGFEWHYQQFPLDKTTNEKTVCQICGKEGNISDEILSAIISYGNTENDDRINTGASYFVEPMEKVKNPCELRNKCSNSNCNFIFPKNIELEEDGVSVTCPNDACRRFNIVGSLNEGHRWIQMDCNGKFHFQQFPVNTKEGEMLKCQICGEEGEAFYVNAFAAIRE